MEVEAPATGTYAYETPWPCYALAWSTRPDPRFRLAVGSFIEHEANWIQVFQMNNESKRLELVTEAEQAFPPTKIMWIPDDGSEAHGNKPDLLASTSTMLNLWKIEEGQLKLQSKFRTRQSKSNLPPLTSFDWSPVSNHRIAASSVDTTCTIWNLEKQKVETQLIAHDKAVYDIAFSPVGSFFASVGADGSMRLFDQRKLEISTIMFEAPSALLCLAWNKRNSNHIAASSLDNGVMIIDIRKAPQSLASLPHIDSSVTSVNSIAWAPNSRSHLLCGTDDGAFIWDGRDATGRQDAASEATSHQRSCPVMGYACDREVNSVQWPASQPDCVALGMAKQVAVVTV